MTGCGSTWPTASTKDFLRRLREYCDGLAPDFFLMGETLHGDYNRWVGDGKCHSCTNYECYKGLYSSLNDMNLFEIGHSLRRQFGSEPWRLYQRQAALQLRGQPRRHTRGQRAQEPGAPARALRA